MADPWIRVHAQLVHKPVVARLSVALRVDPFKAMGHLITFWSNVAAHAKNGQAGDVPDMLLEQWAGWTGKRGLFAKWLRDTHLDADGRVNEWDEYAGALEIRREKERVRLAEKRATVRSVLRNSGPTDAQQTQDVATRARERNGTVRDGTEDQQLKAAKAPPPEWAQVGAAQWGARIGPVTAEKVRKTLARLVDVHGWDAVSAGLADYLTATPGAKAKLEWFAERAVYWIQLAAMPMEDPATGKWTKRYFVVVEGKAA